MQYENSPHIIEVLLPTICSYLNYWWAYGPSSKQLSEKKVAKKLEKNNSLDTDSKKTEKNAQLALPAASGNSASTIDQRFDGAEVTGVTSELTNKVLGYILELINKNIEVKDAQWMNKLSSFTQSIILNSTPDLLEKHFLPVSVKIANSLKSYIQ